ncbi:transcription factor [Bacillus phage DK2]|uniref:Transcription factor n=1 Tax=Bacillus phage DK2 TaxID=2500809 RepID=A0A3T0IIX1_9CAUD|nr:HNH endonuclease [Bacillus phage DK2]AZU99772.1 transcription factor [Bacillus phage DK2]
MGKLLDLTGQTFGKLTCKEMVGRQSGHVVWKCECECGKEKNVRTTDLRSGNTVSCGCQRIIQLKENRKHIKKHQKNKQQA